MNIGIIVNCLTGGGAERCAADLSIYFSRLGHHVVFFTDLSIQRTYQYEGELADFTYKLADTDDALTSKIEELRSLKRVHYIDAAISFMQFANYVNIMSRGSEKVILTTHSVNSEYAKYDSSVFFSEHTFKELYQYADLITFPSEYCRQDWLEHYGDPNNITRTIYNPVHVMPVDSGVPKENIVIAIGRMQGIKRQRHIVRVFRLVKDKCPDSRLVILGDGELRNQLEKLVAQLQLEDAVDMPGNVNNVNDYLARAKVFMMTSICEAMPCSVLEAMSAGVPVAACDIPGGLREELEIEPRISDEVFPIRSECGVITPFIPAFYTDEFSQEERMLADEIVTLLKHDELRIRMGDRARQRALDFSLEKIGAIWDDIINDEHNRQVDPGKFEHVRQRSLAEFHQEVNARNDMYISYYRLLEKWMVVREQGRSARTYFEANGLRKIIIYGLGKMAGHLMEDLRQSDIEIVCAIDKGAVNKNAGFPVISDENDIPEADCIVITPVYAAAAICQILRDKTMISLVSLTDVINGCCLT